MTKIYIIYTLMLILQSTIKKGKTNKTMTFRVNLNLFWPNTRKQCFVISHIQKARCLCFPADDCTLRSLTLVIKFKHAECKTLKKDWFIFKKWEGFRNFLLTFIYHFWRVRRLGRHSFLTLFLWRSRKHIFLFFWSLITIFPPA